MPKYHSVVQTIIWRGTLGPSRAWVLACCSS